MCYILITYHIYDIISQANYITFSFSNTFHVKIRKTCLTAFLSPFWFRVHTHFAKWNQNTQCRHVLWCKERCLYSFQKSLKCYIFMQRSSHTSQSWVEKGTFSPFPQLHVEFMIEYILWQIGIGRALP